MEVAIVEGLQKNVYSNELVVKLSISTAYSEETINQKPLKHTLLLIQHFNF